ncbi:MAG: radical SAM protein [Firmicutes bacterium]|nr:radical SAM protein [Bacillota bacterium]MDY2720048.1 radical SAM protein [Candidatus Faecousia sp.]
MQIQNNEVIKALKQQAKQLGTPLYGAFELTGRCNLNCKMCYVHVMNQAEARKKELTTEQWISIMDEAYRNGMLFALFTGGECLLRPDFKELYLHLYNQGVIMSVNTNGVLINEEMAQFFAQHRPEWIQISLYGSSDEGYEAVTGVRSFSKVTQALELLEKYKITYRVAVTPSRQMLPDVMNIIRYLDDHRINYRVSDDLIPAREDVSREDDCMLTVEERLWIQKEKQRLHGAAVEPKAPEDVPKPGGDGKQTETGMPCNAGTVRFVMDWQGKMHPCMSIPEITEDVMQVGFSTAWNNIRSKMKQVVRPAECSGCVYEKHCPVCPVFRYDGLFSGHCKPEVCQYTARRCAEGLIQLP